MKYLLLLFAIILISFYSYTPANNAGRNITKKEIKDWSDHEKIKLVKAQAAIWLADWKCEDCTDHSRTVALKFFTDDRLNVIETALMEELQYDIPAEVKIAQAIVETGWGRHIKGNNWFGIKGSDQIITTKEYLNSHEMSSYDIISSTQVKEDLYLCVIKDSFSSYATSWESWRAHSLYLVNRKIGDKYLYKELQGKDWKTWCSELANRGYATDIAYGSKLKSIIEKYKLYTL